MIKTDELTSCMCWRLCIVPCIRRCCDLLTSLFISSFCVKLSEFAFKKYYYYLQRVSTMQRGEKKKLNLKYYDNKIALNSRYMSRTIFFP